MGWVTRRSSSEIYTRATTHGVPGDDSSDWGIPRAA